MGLQEARRALIASLQTGTYEHEVRDVLAEKNLLAVGEVDVEFVVRLLQRTRGADYTAVPHVWDSETTVHIFRPLLRGTRWYVKAYFIEEGDSHAVLISVHRRGTRMQIHREGDRGTALAEGRGRVAVEYRYCELELDSGVVVSDVLVGVDPETGQVLTVPAQSEPRIQEARIAVKEEVLEVRVARPLEDVLELLAYRFGARTSRFAPALVRYYLARAEREPELVTRMVGLAGSELTGARRVGRLRVRCRPDVVESVDGLLEGLEGVSRSDLVRGAILAAKEDLLDGGDRSTERSVRAIAAAV